MDIKIGTIVRYHPKHTLSNWLPAANTLYNALPTFLAKAQGYLVTPFTVISRFNVSIKGIRSGEVEG